MKWELGWVLTSNVGVPWANVRVKVSPAATAETIGGVMAGAAGEAKSGEACPEEVQLRVVNVGDGCAALGLETPHAQSTAVAKVTRSAREQMGRMLV
jgi:hypothetical protein